MAGWVLFSWSTRVDPMFGILSLNISLLPVNISQCVQGWCYHFGWRHAKTVSPSVKTYGDLRSISLGRRPECSLKLLCSTIPERTPLILQEKHNRFVRPFQRKSSSIKDCCLFENMENVFHYEKEKTKVKTTTGITFLRFDQIAISFLETISNSKQLSEQNSRRHE